MFLAALSKLKSTCRDDEFDLYYFFVFATFFVWAVGVEQGFSAFWCSLIDWIIKTATCVSRGTTNWGEQIVISGHWANTSWLLVKCSWQSCQSCNLRVRRNLLEENQIFEKCFVSNCEYWEKNFRPAGENLFTGLQRLHSTCSEEPFFGSRCFFQNFPLFLIIFGHWAKTLCSFGDDILEWLPKLRFCFFSESSSVILRNLFKCSSRKFW